jgi:hypothetical protein
MYIDVSHMHPEANCDKLFKMLIDYIWHHFVVVIRLLPQILPDYSFAYGSLASFDMTSTHDVSLDCVEIDRGPIIAVLVQILLLKQWPYARYINKTYGLKTGDSSIPIKPFTSLRNFKKELKKQPDMLNVDSETVLLNYSDRVLALIYKLNVFLDKQKIGSLPKKIVMGLGCISYLTRSSDNKKLVSTFSSTILGPSTTISSAPDKKIDIYNLLGSVSVPFMTATLNQPSMEDAKKLKWNSSAWKSKLTRIQTYNKTIHKMQKEAELAGLYSKLNFMKLACVGRTGEYNCTGSAFDAQMMGDKPKVAVQTLCSIMETLDKTGSDGRIEVAFEYTKCDQSFDNFVRTRLCPTWNHFMLTLVVPYIQGFDSSLFFSWTNNLLQVSLFRLLFTLDECILDHTIMKEDSLVNEAIDMCNRLVHFLNGRGAKTLGVFLHDLSVYHGHRSIYRPLLKETNDEINRRFLQRAIEISGSVRTTCIGHFHSLLQRLAGLNPNLMVHIPNGAIGIIPEAHINAERVNKHFGNFMCKFCFTCFMGNTGKDTIHQTARGPSKDADSETVFQQHEERCFKNPITRFLLKSRMPPLQYKSLIESKSFLSGESILSIAKHTIPINTKSVEFLLATVHELFDVNGGGDGDVVFRVSSL